MIKFLSMSEVMSLYQSDDSIIEGIRNYEEEAGTLMYNKHKEYCLRFMNKMYDDYETNKDIYQDAFIVFIEKVRGNNLTLENTSIQTYLNSICRNQVLVRLKEKGKLHVTDDGTENYDEKYNDWFDEAIDIKNERIQVLQQELLEMRKSGSKCYDLLKKFFFENRTMDQIASSMNYTNADNAKSQKWKCQERLKKQVFKKLRGGH